MERCPQFTSRNNMNLSSSPNPDSSPTRNFSRWCDKTFTHMYSHTKFSPSRARSNPKPCSSSNKSLYISSRDRILANTDRKVEQTVSMRRVVQREVMNDDDPYDNTTDDESDDPLGSQYQMKNKLKSVVTKLVCSDSDQRKVAKDKQVKNVHGDCIEDSVCEGSRPLTPDGVVSKRCLGEVAQEPEMSEVKVKKKKHKRHEVVSSSGPSVKMKSVCIVTSGKEVTSQESTNKKQHGLNSEHSKDRRHSESKQNDESEQAVRVERKPKEKHHRLRTKYPSKMNGKPKDEGKPSDDRASEKKVKEVTSSKADERDVEMPMLEEDLQDSKPAVTRKASVFNPRPFKGLRHPSKPHLSTRDEDQNNDDAHQKSAHTSDSSRRTASKPTKRQTDTSSIHIKENTSAMVKTGAASLHASKTEGLFEKDKHSTTLPLIKGSESTSTRFKIGVTPISIQAKRLEHMSTKDKTDATSTQGRRSEQTITKDKSDATKDKSDATSSQARRSEQTSTKECDATSSQAGRSEQIITKDRSDATSSQARRSEQTITKDKTDATSSQAGRSEQTSTKECDATSFQARSEETSTKDKHDAASSLEHKSTKDKRGELPMHHRTSSIGSASSTSTSASNMSAVSAESEDHVNSKVNKTSSVKMVSFKTAKHLHKKPKRSKEGSGDNNKSGNKESSKKHGSYADKAKSAKSKHSNLGKHPDAAVVLTHLKKEFSNSCTGSESEGSPLKKTSPTQHVTKSLAASVSECVGPEQSCASEKSRDGSEKKSVSSGEAILSRLPVKPFSIDPLVQKSGDNKEVTNKDTRTVAPECSQKIEEPPCVAEQKHHNIHNITYKLTNYKQLVSHPPAVESTTYKLSETEVHAPVPTAWKAISAMEVDGKEPESPKQVASSSTHHNATKHGDATQSESDGKGEDRTKYESNPPVDPAKSKNINQPTITNTMKSVTEEKMPALEDYDVDEGEITSDSEDDSWSQMVQEITKEKTKDKWDYVIDSQKRRFCVEGTTYASPPLQWRTNWHWHGERSGPPPIPRYPPPKQPPPPPSLMSFPPPQFPPPPTYSLYQQASQRMYNSPVSQPPVSQSAWRNPYPASWSMLRAEKSAANKDLAWRSEETKKVTDVKQEEMMYNSSSSQPPVSRSAWRNPFTTSSSTLRAEKTAADENLLWRSKGPKKEPEEDLDGEIYSSSDEDDKQDLSRPYHIPVEKTLSENYLRYKERSNLPPRLQRQRQQQQSTSSQSSAWTSSYHPQNEQGNNDSSNVVVQWDQYGNFTTPQSSPWSRRKSFSPGTQFEYDTSSIVYPYSMRDYIDTHCHIDFLYQRLNYRGTFQKFTTQYHFPPNYAGCVAIFCTPESVNPHGLSKDLMTEDKIWGAFGIHPHHAKYYDGIIEENILCCMKHPKAVALGEIGLDYSNRNTSDWILQQEVFRRQLGMALKMDKPLVIHSRDAEDDTVNIMASMVPRDYPIHRHCFTGTPEEARRWFSVFPKSFIGLTALVTFPSATPAHRTAMEIPLERILLETDAPYFLPRQCPRSLKYANPSMAVFVAERIARLRGITTDEVLVAVRKNTKLMYGV